MSHKSRVAAFCIDCRTDDLDAAVAFWSAALGLPAERDAEGRYAELHGPGGEPRLLLQAVDHDPRIHLDIETDDQPAEIARLEALGARVVATLRRWVVMEAPTGHRFCVVHPQRPDFAQNAPAREAP